jgi:CRP-like cAMP-binding protein
MPDTLIYDGDVVTCQSTLSLHPLFSVFSASQLHELIRESAIRAYQANEIIVKEGELIDAVYFILQGKCEVRKLLASNEINEPLVDQPVATLGEGESVGLSTVGLYSATGSRTATVVALSNVMVLRLDIEVLRCFLKAHPSTNEIIAKQLDTIRRMHFIKSVAPFAAISNQNIKQIAEQIKEETAPAGTTIFKQGDEGDFCYIIAAGKVEISILSNDGNPNVLAELEANTIFGESALIMNTLRNATARVVEPTVLLKIDKALFNEITERNSKAQDALMRLQFKRCRPVKLGDIDMYTQQKADGTEITILRNSTLGKYFQLSDQGLFLWSLLDGESSINDIVIHFYLQYQVFNVEEIANQIINLHNAGFVKLNIDEKVISNDQIIPRWVRVISSIRRIMEYRVAFGNSDSWVTSAYHRVGWIFFTKLALFICTLIILLGFVSFVAHFELAIHALSSSPNKWGLFYLSSFLVTLTIPLHEMAHAFATKYYGRRVHCFGIGWLWLGPFAFCDTSDMWLSPKQHRVVVDLAGIYLNAILAGVAGLFAIFTATDYPTATILLELFALSSYLIVIGNLDTSLEFDGYYALMDVLDQPNLRLSAIKWSVELFSSKATNDAKSRSQLIWESIKNNSKEATYWVCTLVNLVVIHMIVPYVVLTYLLAGLFGFRNPAITIVVILFAVSLSSFGIYKDIAYRLRHSA